MAAHFTTRPCPVCQATTKHLQPFFGIAAELRQLYYDMAADRHLFVDVSADGEVEQLSHCLSCFTMFTERKDGSVVQIADMDEQRFAAFTSPITSSEELEADYGELSVGMSGERAVRCRGLLGLLVRLWNWAFGRKVTES